MKLADKGRFAPPPILCSSFQRVSEVVQSWPGIVSATHWHFSRNGAVDGADFYRGEEELGHIHLDGELHLILSPALARVLITAELARPLRWGGGGWVTFRIRSEDDAAHAAWLMRLAFNHVGGVPEAELVEQVRSVAALRGTAAERECADGLTWPSCS